MEAGEDINKLLHVDLKWVVADRVVATWEDEALHAHFLGRLSSHNKKADFSLLLGHSPDDRNACLLLLHLPLRVRPGAGSKPTDLFLILPPEAFNSPTPLDITTASTSEFPNSHLDLLKSAGLSDSINAVRLAFKLRDPGYVLMPRIKLKNELLGTPRELLLALRSLSQATSFDVYLKRSTYSQVALSDFRAAVLDGSARMPRLRPKSMYQGRGAKQDAWELFGLHANDAGPSKEKPSTARSGESDREGSAPPSYKEVVVKASPPPFEKPTKGPVACTTAEKASGAPQTPDALGRGSISVVEETPSAAEPPTEPPPRKRTFAEAESPTASDNETEADSRKKGPKSLVQLPLFADGSSPIPGSPPLTERPHSSPPASTGPHLPSARSPGPSQHDLSTEDLLREIATWMQDGWAVDAHAHQKLLLPLLALGYHAHRRNLRDFDLAKGRCTSLLYIRLAAPSTRDVAVPLPLSPARAVVDVEDDMAHLVAWANGSVFRGAESVLREETALLGAAAARARDGGLAARGEYVRQKALWVARVFVCFGAVRDVEALAEGSFGVL
ncbi:proline-rich receptor-like protein kinase perk4-like [Diplodia corticola]|uniref:Proline-rich receptor-like protein kinase perk4-like n=1 Tax=Diplodia corticola TaxID=236234 RepID=A0A1J9R158_9PEZI|nr:proline-rich receptor-like protein kinase perk4-like [Diplodia corticola]OJD33986.1 proline-rich receptor-like protein kinase perk4-like [Diplodia corticola]